MEPAKGAGLPDGVPAEAPKERATVGPGVVVMGSSAGGIDALQAVLGSIPKEFPWPILIAQHMAPVVGHLSSFADILQRASALPVEEAKAGVAVLEGHIYTCPSNAEMALGPTGILEFRAPVQGRPERIDHLFASVTAYEDKAIAVVLSGTGTDGSVGALAIKRRGGIVIAESDETASHTGMPQAAIQAGAVDFVRPAPEIGPLLVEIVEGTVKAESPPPAEEDIHEVLDILKRRRGTSFDEYRVPTLRRRMRKRMQSLGIPTIAAYVTYLRDRPKEVDLLFDTLLINVTEFFRDPAAWETIERTVIPGLVQGLRTGQEVRLWCAGCASGEEAYSIAILFAEALGPGSELLAKVKIFATDIDLSALAEARVGRYDGSRLANVSAERLTKFFQPVGQTYEVSRPLRRMVIFGAHDLTKDPPIGRLQLVLCRNVIIYFDVPLQRRILSGFHYALSQSGFLFLGKSEAIPRDSLGFKPLNKAFRIFLREPGPTAGFPASRQKQQNALAEQQEVDAATKEPVGEPSDARLIGDMVLDAPNVAVLLIDQARQIRIANQAAAHLFRPHGERLEGTLLRDSVTSGEPVLEDGIVRALKTDRRVRVDEAKITTRRGEAFLDLTFEPFVGADGGPRVLMMALDVTALVTAKRDAADRAQELQETVETLQTTNEELQSTNEELVTSNEELQSSNEELATLNEELQSTNEELETTNEELQSTNEELGAVNAELQQVGNEVAQYERLLQGLSDVTTDAIMATDANDTVVRWSRQATDLFGIHAEDALKKNVFSLDLQVSPQALRALLAKAATDGGLVSTDPLPMKGRRGAECWAVLTARGVRDDKGRVLGYALAFHDRTEHEASARAVEAANARYQALLRGTKEGVLLVRPDGKIAHATDLALEILRIPRNQELKDLWSYVDDPPALLQLKGALVDLTRATREAAGHAAYVIPVHLRDGRTVGMEFISVGTPGEPPLILLTESPLEK
ncbi:MAG: CheR family methyltransferase [Thermoplasmatota archaeon]